jgi:hypothetical protein
MPVTVSVIVSWNVYSVPVAGEVKVVGVVAVVKVANEA